MGDLNITTAYWESNNVDHHVPTTARGKRKRCAAASGTAEFGNLFSSLRSRQWQCPSLTTVVLLVLIGLNVGAVDANNYNNNNNKYYQNQSSSNNNNNQYRNSNQYNNNYQYNSGDNYNNYNGQNNNNNQQQYSVSQTFYAGLREFSVCDDSVVQVTALYAVCDSPYTFYYGNGASRNSPVCSYGDKLSFEVHFEVVDDIVQDGDSMYVFGSLPSILVPLCKQNDCRPSEPLGCTNKYTNCVSCSFSLSCNN